MNKLLWGVLIVSLIGNIVGLYLAWEYRQLKRAASISQNNLIDASRIIDEFATAADQGMSARMVYVHHSVGKGFLTEGGMTDSLRSMGIGVRGATYGDDIGHFTDFWHWEKKFTSDMGRILTFKAHPNIYFSDGATNDIIMFKSCYPNADITSEGSGPGDSGSREKTIANYKAVMSSLTQQIRKHPDKLFIFQTTPPMHPEATTPANAARNRVFNEWLMQEFIPQYQAETGLRNFVVFDLFSVLADSAGVLRAEFRREGKVDSHPNRLANETVTREFMAFFRPVWEQWQSTHRSQAASVGR